MGSRKESIMNITVYTMPNCVQCDQTKRYLDKSSIEYDTVDISVDTDAYEKVTSMGYKSAPVVVTDTDSWSGFRLTKLSTLKDSVRFSHQRTPGDDNG